MRCAVMSHAWWRPSVRLEPMCYNRWYLNDSPAFRGGPLIDGRALFGVERLPMNDSRGSNV